jgi:hypothetical protein
MYLYEYMLLLSTLPILLIPANDFQTRNIWYWCYAIQEHVGITSSVYSLIILVW